MYPRERIEYERAMWQRKPQLRLLKGDYYRQIQALIPSQGRLVEIGSGCGGMKEFIPHSIASDIVLTPWIDLVMSAERLPLADGSIDALVGVDVLHHMEQPLSFFREAARVLRPGGKLVLLDPYVSLGSWIPWHFLHHEACSMDEPFDFSSDFRTENNARATLWFDRHLDALQSLIRPLAVDTVKCFDTFYYPLMGGFRRWSAIPRVLAPMMLRLDRWLGRWVGKLFGYRMLIVMSKCASH